MCIQRLPTIPPPQRWQHDTIFPAPKHCIQRTPIYTVRKVVMIVVVVICRHSLLKSMILQPFTYTHYSWQTNRHVVDAAIGSNHPTIVRCRLEQFANAGDYNHGWPIPLFGLLQRWVSDRLTDMHSDIIPTNSVSSFISSRTGVVHMSLNSNNMICRLDCDWKLLSFRACSGGSDS